MPQPSGTGLRESALGISETVAAFATLSFASVSMTIGNKLLMADALLAQSTQIVIVLQNLLAVCIMATLALSGVITVAPVSRRQFAYFSWDALVLALQMW